MSTLNVESERILYSGTNHMSYACFSRTVCLNSGRSSPFTCDKLLIPSVIWNPLMGGDVIMKSQGSPGKSLDSDLCPITQPQTLQGPAEYSTVPALNIHQTLFSRDLQ
jgi:hypothetical protein